MWVIQQILEQGVGYFTKEDIQMVWKKMFNFISYQGM